MSVLDIENDRLVVEASRSESERFGYTVERLSIGSGWAAAQASLSGARASVREAVVQSAADIVIARFPSADIALAAALAAPGRTVIPSGSLLYWETSLGDDGQHPPAAPTPDGLSVRVADPDQDATTITSIVGSAFAGYINHYAADVLLEPDIVSAGYQQWAVGTALSERGTAYLLEAEGEPAGLATIARFDDATWEVELAGVVPGWQGRGAYRHFFAELVRAARSGGASRLVISTQTHNVRVQRVWAGLGLKPFAAIDSAHVVDSRLLPGV